MITVLETSCRTIAGRVVGLFVLLYMLYQGVNYSLLSQLVGIPLIYPSIDNTYWLVHLLGIPQLISQHVLLGIVIDIGVVFGALLMLVFPLKRFAAWSLLAPSFIEILCYNSFKGFHEHGTTGMLFILLPFIFKRNFDLAWNGIRYYACFIMVSAWVYKLCYGSLFSTSHFEALLVNQHIYALIHNPIYWRAEMISWVLQTNWFIWLATIGLSCIQLLFIVGWITKRYDKALFAIAIFFHFGGWLLMDLSFWPLWIIYLPFILPNPHKISTIPAIGNN